MKKTNIVRWVTKAIGVPAALCFGLVSLGFAEQSDNFSTKYKNINEVPMADASMIIHMNNGTTVNQVIKLSINLTRSLDSKLVEGRWILAKIDGEDFSGGQLPDGTFLLSGEIIQNDKVACKEPKIVGAWYDKGIDGCLILFQARDIFWPVSPLLFESPFDKTSVIISKQYQGESLPQWNSIVEVSPPVAYGTINAEKVSLCMVNATGEDEELKTPKRLGMIIKMTSGGITMKILPLGFVPGLKITKI